MFISNFPPQENSASERQTLAKSSSKSDSLKQIIEEINEYEVQRKEFKEIEPIFGCFKVLGEMPDTSEIQFSVDSEEERAIMKCFAVCEKTEEKLEPKIQVLKPQIPTLASRGMQTSVMKISEKNSKEFSSMFSQDFEATSSINSESVMVLEIFKNENIVDDSDAAHFTSLTVSPTGASPPDSPAKLISSTAQRVKFSSFYEGFQQIPPQTEPMVIYELEDSKSSESLPPSSLPRFPVHCPITNCSSFNVPSDFCNHITIDHPYVDIMKVSPGKLINITVNHKGNVGKVVCQRMFLLGDKIT